MLSSVVQVAGFAALLAPTALSAALQPRQSLDDIVNDALGRDDGCTNSATSRDCWDGDYTIDTDMDLDWPDTGVTVTYDLEITNTTGAPDGFERTMYLINGQYPGPTIIANWGDTIVVNVKNSLTNNGTGIHWHGLRQLNSTQQDGTNGLTECPIAPAETKTYQFQATQYGSSWYHSHYSVQYGDGIVGGIIINGPTTANWDTDLGILSFTDWWHVPVFTVNAAALHAGGPPTADNLLVNGSMTSDAGGEYAVTTLTEGDKHLLRLVNTGINNYIHVSLDQHPFTVIAADFTPIDPFVTDQLVLSVGQRYDVIIEANQTVGNYWLRVGTGGGACDGPNNGANNTKSIFRYDGADEEEPDSEGITLATGCADETNIVPYVSTSVPQDTPQNLNLSFSITAAENNLVQWHINDSAILVDFKKPVLQYVLDDNTTYPESENIYLVGEANSWQYWVIQQDSANPPLPHPIHLHGHDFYVLASGDGTWSGDTSTLATDNPIRRDTATLPGGGFLVLAFESDNPGIWLMHCHIPFHISAGLGLQFVERRDEILDVIGSTDEFSEGCSSWKDWEDAYPGGFNMGDSGL